MKKVGESLIKNVAHLGIYRIEPGESIYNRRNVGVLLIFGVAFISVTGFLVFGAKTAIEIEECFYLWATLSATITGFFATILKTENIFELLDHANDFLEKRSEDPVRRVIYENAIDLSEILIKIVDIWVLYLGLPSIIIPLVTISYFLYFVAGMGADAFITFNAAMFPFDERTPMGYAVSTMILTVIIYVMLYVLAAALSLIILIFILAMAIAKDMKYKFLNFTLYSRNQAKLVECIKELYNVHSSCIELMDEINDVLELITSTAYISCILTICDSLLMFIGAENGQDMFIRIILLIAAFNNIFIFCELGERISNAYEDAYTDCLLIDYHKFPLAVQKKMVLMMHGAQVQITLTGIGGIACTREAFKDVCTSAYSYFSTFKEM